MLVSTKELYKSAQAKNFAFPAANFTDQLSAASHVAVGEELGLPVILAFAESHQNFLPADEAFKLAVMYADKAKVPVAPHLDHGATKECIYAAIDAGFRSVMIDASAESFEENVRRTSEIVKYAHLRGVVVEAEIGHVGSGSDNDSIYTTVEEAKKFCELTEVDSLAVSIGTAHGAYKGTPVIDFNRLSELRAAVDTPLVLHGGSSSGDDNLRRCAEGGIAKINIYTDLFVWAYQKAGEAPRKNYYELRDALRAGMSDCLKHYYEVFGTAKYNA